VLRPLRVLVTDVQPSSKHVVVLGQVASGSVDVSQPLLLLPAGDRCVVKALAAKDGSSALLFALAGDTVQLTLSDVEAARIAVGDVLCSLVGKQETAADGPLGAADSSEQPVSKEAKAGERKGGGQVEGVLGYEPWVPVSRRFECRLTTLPALAVPFIKGAQVVLHLGHAVVAANVSKLVGLVDSEGAVRKAKPRAVPSGCGAVVHLVTERPLCVETHAECRALGRFVLRQAGVTVAAGLVSKIF